MKHEPIIHRVVGVVHDLDRKRWAELREHFAPRVTTDYVSLFGGTPVEQDSDDLIALWRRNLASVVTQHLLGPIDIQPHGDRIRARCHVRAMHHAAAASGSEWEVFGHYIFELVELGDEYRISALSLETLLQLGNRRLLEEAPH